MSSLNAGSSLIAISLLLTATGFLNCASSPQNNALKENVLVLSSQISLPDVSGRMDHIAYDPVRRRAFITALGNNTVEVADLDAKKVTHTITGLNAPQGIIYLPSTNCIVVADDGGKVNFFDAVNFKILSTIDLGDAADNVRYDAKSNSIYVGFGKGGIAIIDATSMKQIATIPLDGHPESFQLDLNQNRIYINVPDEDEIQVADMKLHHVIDHWKNINAGSNFPMALDENSHRLFVGYRSPSKLRIMDMQSGSDIAFLDCSGDADDVFYNKGDSLIFISAGKGFIDVFEEEKRDHFTRINQIETRSGARTCLWLEDEKKLLLAVPFHNGEPAALWVYDFYSKQ